jgi:hypothetical protein
MNGFNSLAIAKKVARTIIETLSATDFVAVIGAGEIPNLPTCFDEPPSLVLATSQNVDILHTFIDNLFATSFTSVQSAVELSTRMFQAFVRSHPGCDGLTRHRLIMISNGYDPATRIEFLEASPLRDHINQLPITIQLSAFAVGETLDSQQIRNLETLACFGEGVFVAVSTTDTVAVLDALKPYFRLQATPLASLPFSQRLVWNVPQWEANRKLWTFEVSVSCFEPATSKMYGVLSVEARLDVVFSDVMEAESTFESSLGFASEARSVYSFVLQSARPRQLLYHPRMLSDPSSDERRVDVFTWEPSRLGSSGLLGRILKTTNGSETMSMPLEIKRFPQCLRRAIDLDQRTYTWQRVPGTPFIAVLVSVQSVNTSQPPLLAHPFEFSQNSIRQFQKAGFFHKRVDTRACGNATAKTPFGQVVYLNCSSLAIGQMALVPVFPKPDTDRTIYNSDDISRFLTILATQFDWARYVCPIRWRALLHQLSLGRKSEVGLCLLRLLQDWKTSPESGMLAILELTSALLGSVADRLRVAAVFDIVSSSELLSLVRPKFGFALTKSAAAEFLAVHVISPNDVVRSWPARELSDSHQRELSAQMQQISARVSACPSRLDFYAPRHSELWGRKSLFLSTGDLIHPIDSAPGVRHVARIFVAEKSLVGLDNLIKIALDEVVYDPNSLIEEFAQYSGCGHAMEGGGELRCYVVDENANLVFYPQLDIAVDLIKPRSLTEAEPSLTSTLIGRGILQSVALDDPSALQREWLYSFLPGTLPATGILQGSVTGSWELAAIARTNLVMILIRNFVQVPCCMLYGSR